MVTRLVWSPTFSEFCGRSITGECTTRTNKFEGVWEFGQGKAPLNSRVFLTVRVFDGLRAYRTDKRVCPWHRTRDQSWDGLK